MQTNKAEDVQALREICLQAVDTTMDYVCMHIIIMYINSSHYPDLAIGCIHWTKNTSFKGCTDIHCSVHYNINEVHQFTVAQMVLYVVICIIN